jgi:hypothetical protein
MFYKLKRHFKLLKFELPRKDLEILKTAFSGTKSEELILSKPDIDMQTLILSRLLKYLFTNYIRLCFNR